jgi:hypothetical protein
MCRLVKGEERPVYRARRFEHRQGRARETRHNGPGGGPGADVFLVGLAVRVPLSAFSAESEYFRKAPRDWTGIPLDGGNRFKIEPATLSVPDIRWDKPQPPMVPLLISF